MAAVIYQGFMKALVDGDLAGTPDIRCLLVGTSFSGDSGEEDSINLDDFATLGEFDGAGYTRLDCASVTFTYDATDDEYQLDFTNGAGDEFGDPVGAGSTVIQGMVVYLYVDGTAAADIALAYTDTGGFGVNAANGKLGLTLNADGLLYIKAA